MSIKVDFSENEGVIIIDLSYLVHAISFRALNIYKRMYDYPKDPKELWKIDFSKDEEFIGIFTKNVLSKIKTLSTTYNCPKGHVIIAKDCRKKNIWRRDLFQEYKLHRMVENVAPEGLNRKYIFQYVDKVLLPSLESRGIVFTMANDTAEGDDIIAISKNYIRSKEPNREIVILGSDGDFMQLIDDNTLIFTTQGECINDKSQGSPKRDLLYKILIGDGSDGIPGCFTKVKGDKILSRGAGKVAINKLINEDGLLKQKFKEYPKAVEQFKLNSKIIDFRNIPKVIVKDIETSIEDHFYE